jgi:hypothetical protein
MLCKAGQAREESNALLWNIAHVAGYVFFLKI